MNLSMNLFRRNRRLRVLGIKRIHLILLFVVMPEQEPKNDTSNTCSDRNTRIHPDKFRIDTDTGKRNAESRTECGLEQEDRHDERFHAGRRFRVRVFQTSNRRENLGKTDEDITRDLGCDIDGAGILARRKIVTRWR